MKKLILLSILLIVGCDNSTESNKHGCLDGQATNYDATSSIDNNTCTYIDSCGVIDIDLTNDCVKDDCGVWGGDGVDADSDSICDDVDDCIVQYGVSQECGCNTGIASGKCDCDGNILDCFNVCGGDGISDECGICNGDGITDGTCDCDGNILDCFNVCGGDANEDSCGVCSGGNTGITACISCVDVWGENSSLCGEFNYCYPSDSTNTTFSFSKHQGKVFMIIIGTSWDAPSFVAVPEVDEIYQHWANDNRVEIVYFLDDIGQPYSCSQWGNSGTSGIPPILDDGESNVVYNSFENPSSSGLGSLIVFLDASLDIINVSGSVPSLNVANSIIESMLE